MKQIAIYGKGGIGKSTTTSNVAASMGMLGKKVLVIGCDPKADTVRSLTGKNRATTVLNAYRESQLTGNKFTIDQILYKGYAGVDCIESGGPEPGVGCAGRGIITAIEILNNLGLFEKNNYDVVLYDVLGDVVCGGFAMPIRMGLAQQVYTITSGEFMSVYAANNICRGIVKYSISGGAKYAGLICNSRNVVNEELYLNHFCNKINAPYLQSIPRDPIVQVAEGNGMTVIEYAPNCNQAKAYKKLAQLMLVNENYIIPKPMSDDELDLMYQEFVLNKSPIMETNSETLMIG